MLADAVYLLYFHTFATYFIPLGCEYERFGYHYDNPDNTNGSPCGKTFRKGKEEAFKKLLGRIHPGAIVLLHSTSSTNASILDELLTKWEEMGYTFGTLEELVASGSA